MKLTPTEILQHELRTRALTLGDFTLASGRKSTYYINMKRVLLDPVCLSLLGEAFLDCMRGMSVDAVGGPELGAVPLVAATVLRCYQSGWRLGGFFVRKQPKDHGSRSLIEGRLAPHDRAVVLEDVVTTGASTLRAIAEVEAAGAKVVLVCGVVDRLEGGREALAKYNYHKLFTVRDLGVAPDRP